MKNRALITGSSSGIGLELAKIFAKNGNDLVLVALEKDLLTVIREELINDWGVDVYIIEKDLTVTGATNEIFEEVNSQGFEIEYLINNAGFGDFSSYYLCNWEKQERMINLNVMALAHLTRLFLPAMIERGRGKIMNLASNAAFQPGPGMSVYFASKAFVLSFSEALSEELKGSGVTVTALCPGSTKTQFNTLASGGRIKLEENDKRPGPKEVAEFGYRSLMSGKAVAIHGFKNKLIIFLIRFMPRGFVAKQAKKIQSKKFA
jgi:short-subunit dehydrogenase